MDPAALPVLERVTVRPVQEPAEIIPLVNASHLDAIAHAERHSTREVYVVCNEERKATTHVDDESLVSGAVVVIE
jgi:hypothetical protein